MDSRFPRRVTQILVVISLVFWIAAGVALAQMSSQGGQPASPQNTAVDSMQTELHMLTDVQTQVPGVNRRELADYKAFYNERQEPAKKIQLGKAFLARYPASTLAEAVDAGLVNAYIDREDWPNAYAAADSALALKPEDVDVLTTIGWVIPHEYRPDEPNGEALLGKAETYERHAIEILATMPKPQGLTDAQFAAVKSQKSLQAHSALGLVYFRRDNYEGSAKELEQAVENNPSADATDLYVLGIDLQNLKRAKEAAEVFSRCAAIQGSLQGRCQEDTEAMKKLASQ